MIIIYNNNNNDALRGSSTAMKLQGFNSRDGLHKASFDLGCGLAGYYEGAHIQTLQTGMPSGLLFP